MRNKIVIAILVLATACTNQSKKQTQYNGNISDNIVSNGEGEAMVQEPAYTYHKLLIEWLENNKDKGTEAYPNFYGGNYINESGTLVVQIFGDTTHSRKQISAIVNGNQFIIEKVDNSYQSLLKLNDSLVAILIEQKNRYTKNILSTALMPYRANYVEVGLDTLDEQHINEFRRYIIDSPNIQFVGSVL